MSTPITSNRDSLSPMSAYSCSSSSFQRTRETTPKVMPDLNETENKVNEQFNLKNPSTPSLKRKRMTTPEDCRFQSAENFFTLGTPIKRIRDSFSPSPIHIDSFQKIRKTPDLTQPLKKAHQQFDLENPSSSSLKEREASPLENFRLPSPEKNFSGKSPSPGTIVDEIKAVSEEISKEESTRKHVENIKLVTANGSIFFYNGDWEDDSANGIGTAITSNGETYVGDWKNGQPHGQGKFAYNGIFFVGEVVEGNPTKGTLTLKNLIYEGPLDNSLNPHGFGKITYSTGCSYEGEFSHGKCHGKGTKFAPDKTLIYAGEWENDQPHGEGMSFVGTEVLHIGRFENGRWISHK